MTTVPDHRRLASQALDRVREMSGPYEEAIKKRFTVVSNALDYENGSTSDPPPEIDTVALDIAIDDARFEIETELRYAQIHATLAQSAPPPSAARG
jgi:hypothetical protein